MADLSGGPVATGWAASPTGLPHPGGRRPGSPHAAGRSGPVAWMAIPALAIFIVFGIVPLFGVLFLSFTQWDGLGAIHPTGFANWRSVLSDPGLPHSIWVTFEIMILSWAVQTPLSLLLGTFLAGRQRYRGFLAVLFFVPLLLSSAAIAITYKALLDPNFGLGAGLKIGFLTQDWLGNSTLALGVVIFVVSWQFIPFHSLIYQGGVRQIPTSMYEAASIDGAGRVRQFFSITVPQLKYTIITSSTLMVVGSLTFFDLIFVLTAGGPGDATRVLALDMYKRGFQANLMGPASVIAVLLVLIGLALALLLRRLGGSTTASQQEGA
ncbi:sugar ABC transporter permease [Kribbella sp. NPDC023972]|uniref:carbohydrate ABC transporter permease n=1 Tax=Kribbella sp. NPDC023972 TaxID=3154795 RepID=UPI003408B48E